MNTCVDMDPFVTLAGIHVSSKALMSELKIPFILVEYQELPLQRIRFTELNLPAMGQWDEIIPNMYGDVFTHNQYIKQYPVIRDGICIRNRLKMPTCERLLYFVDNTTHREMVFSPIINPVSEDDCLIVHCDTAKFMLTCISKTLCHLKQMLHIT